MRVGTAAVVANIILAMFPNHPAAAKGLGWAETVPLASYVDRSFPMAPYLEKYGLAYESTKFTAGDMHLVGPVRAVTEIESSRLSSSDDLFSKTARVTTFRPDGRLVNEAVVDLLKDIETQDFNYRYDRSNRLVAIEGRARDGDAYREQSAIFAYDSYGRLSGVLYKTAGQTTFTIELKSHEDGRPQETLAKDARGIGVWRLSYEYGDGTVTIHRFYNEGTILGSGVTTSVFKLDGERHLLAVETHQIGDPGSEPRDTFDGIYQYTYHHVLRQPFTAYSLNAVETYRKVQPKVNCRLGVTYINGVAFEGSVHLVQQPNLPQICGYGIDGPIREFSFDNYGNYTSKRSGNVVTELGRKLVRWGNETTWVIKYYGGKE